MLAHYEWDETKRRRNQVKHGVDFAQAVEFDWHTALVVEDDRRDYGEPQSRVLGLVGDRVHVMAVAVRGDLIRIISLRKANRREVDYYASQEIDPPDQG